jgi:hypothetical protein
MLDSRYDDLETGRVEPIDGEEAFRRLREKGSAARGEANGIHLLGHLMALKVLARDDVARPQDAGDLRALVRRASAGKRDPR